MFKINDKVNIKDTNILGKISSISNNYATIKTKDFKNVKVSINKLILSDYDDTIINKVTINYSKEIKDFSNEIMLRHLTKEDALQKLELFISKCLMNKIYEIRIIHGKNGGILRNAVHEYLKASEYIESFKLAGYFEGQYGVTIAKIHKKC